MKLLSWQNNLSTVNTLYILATGRRYSIALPLMGSILSVLRLRFRNTMKRKPQTQCSSIFLIPEIFEKILLDVPAIDVIARCRGVCITWKEFIEVSPDLKYYSLSGLRRPRPAARATQKKASRTAPIGTEHMVSGPSRVADRWSSNSESEPQTEILTPLALEVLSIFWNRLVEQTVATLNDWEKGDFSYLYGRARRCHIPLPFPLELIRLIKDMIVSLCKQIGKQIDGRIGRTAQKYRAVNNLGRKLIKEFTPILEKIHIFNQQDPEPMAILITPLICWKMRADFLVNGIDVGAEFSNLPEAVLKLLQPLILAGIEGQHQWFRLIPPASNVYDTPKSYDNAAVIIGLRRQPRRRDQDGQLVRTASSELIVFEPFNVWRGYERSRNFPYQGSLIKVLEF